MTQVITLSGPKNAITLGTIDTLLGGSGTDAVTLTASISNATIDLGAGLDKLVLGGASNTASIANVETIVGGSKPTRSP